MPMYAPYTPEAVESEPTGIGSAIDRYQGLNYQALAAGAKMTGLNTAENWARERARQNLAQANEYTPKVGDIRNITGIGTGLEWANEQFVQNAPQMAAMVTGAGMGALAGGVPGALAGGAATIAPMHFGEASLRQEEENVYNPKSMLAATAINTLLDLYTPAKAVNIVRGVDKMGTLAKAVMTGAARESSTEVAQSVVTDAQAGVAPDLQDSEYLWAKANEAAAGGLLGGVMTGRAQATQRLTQGAKIPGNIYDSAQQRLAQGAKVPGQIYDSIQQRIRPQQQQQAGMSADLTASGIRNSLANNVPLTEQQQEVMSQLAVTNPERYNQIMDLGYGRGESAPYSSLDAQMQQQELEAPRETSLGLGGDVGVDTLQFRKVQTDEGGVSDEVPANMRSAASPSYIYDNLYWDKDKFNEKKITLYDVEEGNKHLIDAEVERLNESPKTDWSTVSLGDAMVAEEADSKTLRHKADMVLNKFTVPEVRANLEAVRREEGDIGLLNMFKAVKRQPRPKGFTGPLETFDNENLYGSPKREGIITEYSESSDVKERTPLESGYIPVEVNEGKEEVFNLPRAVKIRKSQIKKETGESATYAQALASVLSEDGPINLIRGNIEDYMHTAAAKIDWIYSKELEKKYPFTRTIAEVSAISPEAKTLANIESSKAKIDKLEEQEWLNQKTIDSIDPNDEAKMETAMHNFNITQMRIRRAVQELGQSQENLARLRKDPNFYRDDFGLEEDTAEGRYIPEGEDTQGVGLVDEPMEGYDTFLDNAEQELTGKEAEPITDKYGGQRDDYVRYNENSAKKAGGAPGGSANPMPGKDLEVFTDEAGNRRTRSVYKKTISKQGQWDKANLKKISAAIKKNRSARTGLIAKYDNLTEKDKQSAKGRTLARRIEKLNDRINELNARGREAVGPTKKSTAFAGSTEKPSIKDKPKNKTQLAKYIAARNQLAEELSAIPNKKSSEAKKLAARIKKANKLIDKMSKPKPLTKRTPVPKWERPETRKERAEKERTKKYPKAAETLSEIDVQVNYLEDMLKDPSKQTPLVRKSIKDELKKLKRDKYNVSRGGAPSDSSVNKSSREKTQGLADEMLKNTGVKVSIVSDTRAKEMAAELKIPDYELGMKHGSLHGFASASPREDGAFEVYVNPLLSGVTRDEILAHELGHTVMYSSGLNASSQEATGVINEFKRWSNKYGQDNVSLDKFIKSKKTNKAALLYLQNALRGQKIGDLDPTVQEYLKDFDEWFADEAAKALLRKTKPRNAIQAYFDRIVQALRELFGYGQTQKFIDSLGKDPEATPKLVGKQVALSSGLSNAPKVNKALTAARRIIFDKDQNLRATKIPAIVELADMMYKKKGSTGMDNTYWNQKMLYMGKFDSRMNDIMKNVSREEQNVIIQELYTGNDNVSPRAKQIRLLLKDIADYMDKAGVDVQRRKNYFPEVVDPEYLQSHQKEFTDMMGNYPNEMQRIANDRTEQAARMYLLEKGYPVNAAATTKLINDGTIEPVNVKDVPYMLFDQLVSNGGVADFNIVGQQTPGMRFINSRLMSFMKGEDRVVWQEKFLQGSVLDATSAYVQQAVKRAEYERRFGQFTAEQKDEIYKRDVAKAKRALPKGQRLQEKDYNALRWWVDNHSKLDLIIRDAVDQGASPREQQMIYDAVGAELGTYGRRTAYWLNQKLGIPMPMERSPINPTLQKINSTLMSIANVWVLGMSTLTSIADPVGIAVRTGSVSAGMKAMADGIRESVKGDKSELQHLATAIGSISDTATKESLAHGYSGVYMSPRIKRMNDFFFKAIGLEAWTRTTRLMAVSGARSFMKRHDKFPNKHSERFLKELGLKEGDIKYNTSGEVKVLSYEEHKAANEAEQARDNRIRSAISEFVDTSILRPNPSQRPLWASDPHFALIFHLKSFMYSFQKTILNRLYHEAKMGNVLPLMAAGSYIPVLIAVGLAKDIIKDIGDDDEGITPTWKQNWGIMDYVWDGVQKSGLTGITQPVFDFMRDRRFGGSGVGAFISPGLEPDTFSRLPVPFNYLIE